MELHCFIPDYIPAVEDPDVIVKVDHFHIFPHFHNLHQASETRWPT